MAKMQTLCYFGLRTYRPKLKKINNTDPVVEMEECPGFGKDFRVDLDGPQWYSKEEVDGLLLDILSGRANVAQVTVGFGNSGVLDA